MLIKVRRLQSCHSDIEVGHNDRGDITLIDAIVEGLNVQMVGQHALNLGLDKDVRYNSGQVVCCDLLVLVQGVGLLNDLHDLLQLL